MKVTLKAALFGALLLAVSGCRTEPQLPTQSPEPAAAAEAQAAPASQAATVPLTIASANGAHHFDVEVARTVEEQARGLMFREALPADGGMIFPFAVPRMASFWMRNTLIPLDMIFIRADGTIANIEKMTEPYSLDSRMSAEPVAAVLEIDGGRSDALGIAPGDRVTWQDSGAGE